MPSSRGYHSYRGRGSKLKIALAVVLTLVILASLGVMAMSRYIAYDEYGTPFLRLPPEEETPQEEPALPPEEDLTPEIIIQEPPPEAPPPLRAVSMPEGALTVSGWTVSAMEAVRNSQDEYNAIAITMGNAQGTLYFDAASAVRGSRKTLSEETPQALEAAANSSLHSIARISGGNCFRVANINVTDMGLRNTGGYIFYDLYGSNWLDPAKPAARAYVQALAAELADLGFDEILLTDMGYPTAGKLDRIAFTGSETLYENVEQLLSEVRAALAEKDVLLSVELPENVVLEGFDPASNLRLEGIVPYVDRVYVQTSPEQMEALTQAVSAVSDTVELVSELTAPPENPDENSRYLILK